MNSKIIDDIKPEIAGMAPGSALAWLADKFPGQVVFSTSFGWEDQVITHMIFSQNLPIKIFTLENRTV